MAAIMAGSAAFAWTPVLPEAILVRPLSALTRRSYSSSDLVRDRLATIRSAPLARPEPLPNHVHLVLLPDPRGMWPRQASSARTTSDAVADRDSGRGRSLGRPQTAPAGTVRGVVTELTTTIATIFAASAMMPTLRSRIACGRAGNSVPTVACVKLRNAATIAPTRIPAKAPAGVVGLRGIRLAMTAGKS